MTTSVQRLSRATPTLPTPVPDNTLAPIPSNAAVKIKPNLKTDLADKQNLLTLGDALSQLARRLGADATAPMIVAALKTTSMAIDPDSRYPHDAGRQATLEDFIGSLGLPLPDSHFALNGLSDAVIDRGQVHPLGNLGGALSWPVPLSADEQRRVRLITMSHVDPHGQQPQVMQTKGLLLEFLRLRTPLPAGVLNNPAKALEALISSPEGQLLGETLQKTMQGVATDSSTMDYLLAAVTLQLDPESIIAPRRKTLAGFDLASDKHWGKPLSTVVDGLKQHLVAQGKTSAAMAGVAAHVLLAGRAPALLIKDIPASVTYGSLAWVNLSVAAATIEAQTPGKVANMTFAEVMLAARNASLADPAVTERVQREVLVDWGVANGVLARKDDQRYSLDELTTLLREFNARRTLIGTATHALDADIPSRKAMALAELKKRFPEQQALFEEKLIHISRKETTSDGGVGYRTLEVGPHSMLDVAMMDLPDADLAFTCDDTRVPLAALNANPRFGVAKAFESQFASTVKDKKAAINTYVKHLISQAPLAVREDLEYGKISFFQEHSRTLGPGFTGSTSHPKNEQLLVKIERDGVTKAYAISFNKGTIEPVGPSRASAQNRRAANVVHETKAFTPKGDVAVRRDEQKRPDQSPPDSFNSGRTGLIADAFVQHVDLDDDAIKQQARGLTTADNNRRRGEAVSEAILDLIPFRAAFNNFRKGNIGEGLLDLGLDLFGIVTAGVGTAGKVIKIAGTATSTATKLARAVKVIGMATFSSLNPLGGLGDAALGATRLVGSGFSKGVEWLNHVRGATGGYDLLKAASKEHGPTLIGTYKVSGIETEGVAVLKNDHWYKYDPVTNKPYGMPIDGFSPRGAPELHALTGVTSEPAYLKLHNNIVNATKTENYPAYKQGYLTGRLEELPGYRDGMGSSQLRKLAEAPGRPPHEVGILSRELKRAYVRDGEYTSALLLHDVMGPGVSVLPFSQAHYNAYVDLPSVGECAGISYAMALALHQGTEEQLVKNLLKVAEDPASAANAPFATHLRNLQDAVKKPSSFHFGGQVEVGYDEIIEKMLTSGTSTTIRIGTVDHAMLAGVQIKNGKPEWFFFDPNAGLVKFTNLKSMERGMEELLNSGQSAALRNTRRTLTGKRAYSISIFEPGHVNNRPGINPDVVRDLSSVAL
ncbi:hypothetical protein EXW72_04740 [Pseudomonas sp. BCA14]|uniref:hypothetical protein n=1 Tax=unclassified Pseudomonas TaxID=196821 RepID=UPI00106E8B4C|nr:MULTISPECIES: hypothetical protein [unclassified Pseudomonas]TFF14388.1 hypothetical protein EXW70_07745 [Pseudomonas sp. JMN1]TFF14928.1 hypothetical protein EXW71_01295 [Pseudomonas sp. BCA17]TFF31334.1 hypothetical protein EXW72_04740 [Pseudomonas sp. BCA14]TFF32288.1 hypothetical protein EXW73_00545 [Pseudomonas sp. BCA13]